MAHGVAISKTDLEGEAWDVRFVKSDVDGAVRVAPLSLQMVGLRFQATQCWRTGRPLGWWRTTRPGRRASARPTSKSSSLPVARTFVDRRLEVRQADNARRRFSNPGSVTRAPRREARTAEELVVPAVRHANKGGSSPPSRTPSHQKREFSDFA